MNAGRTLFFIALGLFGLYAVEFGVVGILPVIIERYGVTVAQAGWLVGLFALVVAVCGPFMVLWLSRFNRRKVLAGGLFVFAASSLTSAWAPSFAVLMLLRVVPALLHPVFFAMAFAAAVALYPKERATHATTMAFVGTSMGLVLGVPLTAWIAARFSYEASFVFCAAVNAVAGIGLLMMLPDGAKNAAAGAIAIATPRHRNPSPFCASRPSGWVSRPRWAFLPPCFRSTAMRPNTWCAQPAWAGRR